MAPFATCMGRKGENKEGPRGPCVPNLVFAWCDVIIQAPLERKITNIYPGGFFCTLLVYFFLTFFTLPTPLSLFNPSRSVPYIAVPHTMMSSNAFMRAAKVNNNTRHTTLTNLHPLTCVAYIGCCPCCSCSRSLSHLCSSCWYLG